MDLQVDAAKIRSLRSRKAWSQEHLAQVAGLGRRTIQRVEKSGTASYESALAIAAALEIDVAELTSIEKIQIRSLLQRNLLLRKISISLTALVMLLLFAISKTVTADQVRLDIQAIVNEEHETEATVTNEEGEGSKFQLAGNYRLVITPTITTEGDIRLELLMMKQDGEQYTQVGAPVIRTPDGETAMIKSASDDGQTLTLEITPSIL